VCKYALPCHVRNFCMVCLFVCLFIYLFIFIRGIANESLANERLCTVKLNEEMNVYGGLERFVKEAVVAYLRTLTLHLKSNKLSCIL